VVQRYLHAVESDQADGWHTLVYGLTMAVYSLPLRQGLLGYAHQTTRGFIYSGARMLQPLRAPMPRPVRHPLRRLARDAVEALLAQTGGRVGPDILTGRVLGGQASPSAKAQFRGPKEGRNPKPEMLERGFGHRDSAFVRIWAAGGGWYCPDALSPSRSLIKFGLARTLALPLNEDSA
jgi:hypothetical protein